MQIIIGLASLCFLVCVMVAAVTALSTFGLAIAIIVITCIAGILLLPVILPALGAAGYMDAKGSKEWAQAIKDTLKLGSAAVLTLAMCALPIAVMGYLCIKAWHDGLLVGIIITLFSIGFCANILCSVYSFWWRMIENL